MKGPDASTTGTGYERSDARAGPLLAFAAGLAALVGIVLVVSALLARERAAVGEDVHPMASERGEPSGPLLQATPGAELDEYLESERERLSTYGWVDREGGLARIPIERAMEILLERGFEARQAEREDGR